MRIGVIVDNEYTNDIRVTNECDILSDDKHKIFVLALNFSDFPNYDVVNPNLIITRVPISRKLKNLLFALTNFIDIYSLWWSYKIKYFCKENNLDAIHVHDLYMSKAAHWATKKQQIKFTLDLHENYPYAVMGYKWMNQPISKYIIRPWRWIKKEKKYLSYPDKIVVLSDYFKNELLKKYNFLQDNKIHVFPNVPNIEKLLTYTIDKNILPNDDDYILFYFGAVSKRRGIGLLFDSLVNLTEKIPNLKLLLIGPVDKAEKSWFNLKLEDPLIKKHTIFYPWKDISLLPSYISTSNICLSPIEKNPQHESGIANKVFQYMLFEKPVLVSDCAPQSFIINNYYCGLDFTWNSVQSFNKQVLKIYNNPELSNEMGNNGRLAVTKFFNSSVLKNNLTNIYK